MSDEKLNALKKKRGVLRTAVTKILSKLEIELKPDKTDVTVDNLEEFVEILQKKFESLQAVDKELELLFDPEVLESEIESAEEYNDKVTLWKFRATKRIDKLKCNFSTRSTDSKNEQIDNSVHDLDANSKPKQTDSVRIKLPKLSISKFYGDVSQWLTFWNSYESAIHNNEALDKVDKFNYLKAHLGGSALSTVQGFAISAATYDSAIDLLKERFAKPDLLVHTHMSNILNIRPLKSSADIRAFRQFYDKVSTELRSLECLGLSTENCSSVLCTAVIKALPPDILLEFHKNENENAYSDVKELLNFLSKTLTARERSEMNHSSDVYHNNRHIDPHFHPPRRAFNSVSKGNKSEKERVASAAELISMNVRENKIKTFCVFCNSSDHVSSNCDYAHNITLDERKDILRKKGACFRCLSVNKHISRFCKSNVICSHCSGKHASVMCFAKYKPNDTNEVYESSALTNQSYLNEVYLQTLIVRIANEGIEHYIRICIDTGSSKSYVSKFVVEKMGLRSFGKVSVTHGLFGGVESTESHNKYFINLKSIDGKNNLKFEVMDQKKICAAMPKIKNDRCIKELKEKGIFLSDICPKSKICLYEESINEIHVLLGADIAGKLFTGKIESLSCGLVAVQTVLGWSVMGKISDDSKLDSSLLVLSLHVNEAKITDLWNLDSLGITDPSEQQSKEEINKLVLKHFKETVSRESDGRYKVCIPWLDGPPPISDNKVLAEKRLKNTVKTLKSTNTLKDYEQVFNEWEEEGVIEKIIPEQNLSQLSNIHYLPHRAVVKESSTTKIRPVFDGSARTGSYGSLNDCIEKGPNLIELIPSVLNRFRLGKIGVIADIRRAFLQIALHERDRNYLRFLWWKEGDPENVITYRHCRVVFGIACSPFQLAATLSYHLDQAPESLKALAEKLKDSMYVDNCVASVDSEEELNFFRTESQKLLSSAKFDLRGWCHNNYRKNEVISPGEHPLPDPRCVEEIEVPVLGLSWNTEEDTLSCDFRGFKVESEPITKRKILSLAHKIFDPIGFTCPTTLIPKLLLQECWKLKVSWDSELPDSIINEFKKWKAQVMELKKIAVPRRLSTLSFTQGKLSLHIFCDACKKSYATCIFLRIEFQNQVTCQLVQARSRVAPLKKVTIPRLELLACCIGSRLAATVKHELKMENVDVVYWSDSMDALHWIKKEGPWATFVENRVREIRRLSPTASWKFVPGSQNPADLPSRGCSPLSLVQSKWWLGPDWLLKPEEEWPRSNTLPDMAVVNSEKKKIIITAPNLENSEQKFYNCYSSYPKLLRITGWIYRFYNNSKKSQEDRIFGQLNNNELQKAERIILKQVQNDAFSNESDKRLKSLHIIVDSDGILRVKSKIFMREDDYNFRLPIVLPTHHHVVKLLIIWKHLQLGHSGVQLLMSSLRENFWILKSRKAIKNAIRTCVTCKRHNTKPPEILESVLPEDRVRKAVVFEIIGIDVAGPLILKEGHKVWILILTCAVFRTVHLELLTSLSTDNFLLGLRRFISRRGRPSVIYCDNATNFVGAQNLLKNIDFEKLKSQPNISSIEWKFIPPSAPWWGGFYERLIGILKRMLRKVLGRTSLNYEELLTVLCDCECTMNARPLTYVSDDIEDLNPITPSMFLHEIKEIGVPDLDCLNHTKINKRYNYRQKILQDLRTRFRAEYLGQLRQTSLNGKNSKSLQVGDIVIIWTENSKRITWPLGKILEVYPSRDGVVRIAKIKTQSGILIRPVKKLCPLELSEKIEIKDTDKTLELVPETLSGTDQVESSSDHPRTTRTGRVVRKPSRYRR